MRKILFSAALSLASASAASASLIAYEGANYPAGALLGQANTSTGTSWLRAGASASPTAINVVNGSLTGPAGLPPSVGNSIAMTGIGDSSGSCDRLALPGTISSGTVYYSLLLRGDSLSGSNNTIGGFLMGLNNTGNSSQTTNPSVVGAKIQSRIDPSDSTKYDIGIFANITATAGATSWAPAMSLSTTHLIVCAYTFNTGSTLDDVSSMWIDPDSSTFGSPSAPPPNFTSTSTVAGNDLSPGVSSLLLRQSPAPFFTLDEIRVGTAWSDVFTVPEPASLALVLVGASMLARKRRA